MKSCPVCKRTFAADAGFCPQDGTALVSASLVPVAMPDDPRVGTKLANRYEIRRVVADGGMGRVYEAIDREKNARVAVKVLHDEVARDDVSLARFKREWDISTKLPHDYIVEVSDFQRDQTSNVWLLVMEFLDGEELRLVLKREKTLAPERLVRMLSHVAIGLDAAHAQNFVHRDLKPDNLFMCGRSDGDLTKILDFGSVKDKNTDAKKLTVLGTTIGSPYYMAPEQAQGLDTLDARADVFALGAIAYECITGEVPFPGTNGPSILLGILTKDAVPPSEKGAKLESPPPPTLDDVMEEALAKNPNIRTRSVGLLADAVGRAYGLAGDHKTWAVMPLASLASEIQSARPRVMARAVDAAIDPFAAPPPPAGHGGVASASPAGALGVTGPNGIPPYLQGGPAPAGPAPAYPGYPSGPVSPGSMDDVGVAGLPGARPPWMVPALVGGAALVVGAVIALLVAISH